MYQENESAWKSEHQKELSKLLIACRCGIKWHDIVLIWALDRLSKESAAAALNLINTFIAYGIRVISYQESWTETPQSAPLVSFSAE